MAEGWNRKASENKAAACWSAVSRVNDFLVSGREAIQHAASGRYKRARDTDLMWRINNPIRRDADIFGLRFNQMIGSLNHNRC